MAARTLAQAILLSEAEKREGSATGAVCLQQGLPKQGSKDESERLKPVTFGHLSEALVRLAGVLRSPMIGAPALSPGSVAAIVMPNSVAFAGAFIGTTVARGVAAPLNPKYTKAEFAFYLEDQRASAVFLPRYGAPQAAIEAAGDLGIRCFQIDAVNDPEWGGILFTVWDVGAGDLLRPAAGASAFSDFPRPEDVALLLHTSGTTSRPKGVPLTHANICASIGNIRNTYEFGPKDVSLLVMPLFHVHGLMCGLLTALACRSQVVIPEGGAFSAQMFWKDAQHFRITWYTAVPTIHQVLLLRAAKDYPSQDPPPLRLIRSSSSSLAPAILARLEGTFKAPVVEAYAMTEACHQMTSNPLRGRRIPGSVGRGTGVDVAILDDKLRVLPPKKVGEVCIRGPNVTPGYLNNPKATEEAFAGGWFHTGDQGWLDEGGYLTLTGRLKELINRGGEKISPLEIDAAMISHQALAEAVAFGMPDEKYGEVVHAAVVAKQGMADKVTEASVIEHCRPRLASFKIPIKIHFLEVMPKTPTGKVQRRMVRAFVQEQAKRGGAGGGGGSDGPARGPAEDAKGFDVVARCLSRLGVKHMMGVVGIPVTQLASSAQCNGIRFLGFRNEQSAGYAASCLGYLTGRPAVLLTVSGPGVVHGLAGLANATANCWPMVMISGSVERKLVGKGGFQELDQCEVAGAHCKRVFRVRSLSQIGMALSSAIHESLSGRPGGVYVDIPADVLFKAAKGDDVDEAYLKGVTPVTQDVFRFAADEAKVAKAAALLLKARRPLVIVGKGGAYSRVERELAQFVDLTGMPCLPSPMAKGLVPDGHPLCVGAARSKAMREADVVLVLGTRLNWQWSFGEHPQWSSKAKFVVVDTLDSRRRPKHLVKMVDSYLYGDARMVLSQLTSALRRKKYSGEKLSGWTGGLQQEAQAKRGALAEKMAAHGEPMGFHEAFGAINGVLKELREAHSISPILVNEGANTMDIGRQCLEIADPRGRLDAGTMGTMGVGLGYAIAAALSDPKSPVLAVLGDSAFGFSMAEIETITRYSLNVIVVVMDNGGVYGGDRRSDGMKALVKAAGFGSEPPTALSGSYDQLMRAFGGEGSLVKSREGLGSSLRRALMAGKPALINCKIDPLSGSESARMNHMNHRSKL